MQVVIYFMCMAYLLFNLNIVLLNNLCPAELELCQLHVPTWRLFVELNSIVITDNR